MSTDSSNISCDRHLIPSESLNRIKDRLLAQVAHDIRNMASVFSGAVQLAEARGTLDHLRRAQRGMNAQVLECVVTIENVMEFARLLGEPPPSPRERAALKPLLVGAVKAAQPVLESRGQQVDLADDERVLQLDTAPHALERNVLNLLLAASRNAQPDTHLHLHAREDLGYVEVILEFRPSQPIAPPQSVETCLSQLEGTPGMGFAPALCVCVARVAAEREGGSVVLRQEENGLQAYAMRLPAATGTAAPAPLGEATGSRPKRVLLVDDNNDTVASLALLLRLKGYDAHTASEGEAALQAAATLLPDVILLDLGLPGMDGFEVAAALRRQHEFQDTLIVALSGYGDAQTVERAKATGFNHHFVKPVDNERLLELIERSLPRPRAEDIPREQN